LPDDASIPLASCIDFQLDRLRDKSAAVAQMAAQAKLPESDPDVVAANQRMERPRKL
jgi:hypothetical protein